MNEAPQPPSRSLGRVIGYWICTVIIAFIMGAGGIADILQPAPVIEGMTHLGYPLYFCTIIGVWKVGGAITILAPRLPLIKEWAYAGIVFDLTGASASHFALHDDLGNIVAPLVFTVITFLSWILRPASRRLF